MPTNSQSAAEHTSSSGDPEIDRVNAAIDELLAAHDPNIEDDLTFRGHQFDAGLAWVHFNVGDGGLGVDAVLQRHVAERLVAADAPRAKAQSFFMQLAGPTIASHGTAEQKGRFLRPMFTGEHTWCQLFSEPGAGSDFAGLGTKAERDGDEWLVNGQKVWNTLAHVADYGMLVTRSDPSTPKHKGMTYFAMDMASEGVEVRPLRQITGEAEFNEVYMTDVRIPDSNRIGAEGEGWRVSLTTLMNERNAIGSGSGARTVRGGGPISSAVDLWLCLPEEEKSAAHKDELMSLWIRAEVLRLTNMRASGNRRTGNPGPEMSIGKLAMAELNQEISSHCLSLQGADGMIGFDYTFRRPEELSVSGLETSIGHGFLRCRANSIEGGTSEIMRNILGEQVLGLPGEPRVDKALPWSEVARN